MGLEPKCVCECVRVCVKCVDLLRVRGDCARLPMERHAVVLSCNRKQRSDAKSRSQQNLILNWHPSHSTIVCVCACACVRVCVCEPSKYSPERIGYFWCC